MYVRKKRNETLQQCGKSASLRKVNVLIGRYIMCASNEKLEYLCLRFGTPAEFLVLLGGFFIQFVYSGNLHPGRLAFLRCGYPLIPAPSDKPCRKYLRVNR